ncbi:glycosyltransferase family 4 protein [Methanococcus sp. CF]
MNIGVIANTLNPPKTGVGNYVYNILKCMTFYSQSMNLCTINYTETCFFEDIQEIIIDNPFNKFNKNFLWAQTLPFSKSLQDLDIIHNPYQLPTFTKFKQKYIMTTHDIIQTIFFEETKKSIYLSQKIMLLRSLKSADKIIAVSENTKNDLINHFKIPPNKIKVIYNAADKTFAKLNEIEISDIKKKYAINYSFILYVGGLAAHKNIIRLIEAYNILKKLGVTHKLVLAGVKRYKYKEIFETIEKLNLQNDVIFTGYVPDEDLPGLYNAADLFVYPSLYEGFGIPPLEAMQCGTPVITSNTSSLPEVVGDAGIMVNPYDVDELANKMYEVLTNEYLRKEMSKKGLERAKLFSWKKCAEEHIKVYEEVYNMK